MRRRGLHDAVLKEYGYPAQNGTVLKDGHGNVIGKGRKVNCTKIRPGQRGDWISNERCSYQFKIRGLWYGCRGMGDGMAASCRVMKRAPADARAEYRKGKHASTYFDKLDGARRRRRRR